jgi:hypothetical protein
MASHKLVRWMLFPAFLGWLVGPLLLLPSAPWTLLLSAGMIAGLVLARLVLTWPDDRKLPKVIAFPGYLFISIVAGWKAWLHLLKQEKSAMWEPTQRPITEAPRA